MKTLSIIINSKLILNFSRTNAEPMTVFLASSGVRPVLRLRKHKMFDQKPNTKQLSVEKDKDQKPRR